MSDTKLFHQLLFNQMNLYYIKFLTLLFLFPLLTFSQDLIQDSSIIFEKIDARSNLSEISNHFDDGELYVYRNKPFYKIRSKYYDIYKIKMNKSVAESKFMLLKNVLNTPFNEGPIFFDKPRNLVYVTRNKYTKRQLRKLNIGINPLEVDVYRETSEGFEFVEKFKLNDKVFSVGHVTVSNQTNRLYFASNQEGTIGEQDLFYTTLKEDGTFETPINLGKVVNTKKDEAFPKVYNGILYFSSKGRHKSRKRTDWDFYYVTEQGLLYGEKPKQVSAPLNSLYDDFGLAFINDKEGYITSNRNEEQDYNHDIYYFDLSKPIFGDNQFNLLLTGIDDKEINSLKAYRPKLIKTGEDNKGIKKETVKKGYLVEKLDEGETYELVFPGNSKYQNIKLGPFTKKSVSDVFIIDTVKLILKKPDIVKEVVKDTLVVKEEVKNRIEQIIKEEPKAVQVEFKNIYFDLNSAEIRPGANKELNSMVQIMNDKPELKLKIWAHTDSRATIDYNLKLSNDRALSVKKYLIEKGISENRIIEAKGFGESKIINACVDNVLCGEDQHQVNRRVEFVVVKD